MRKEERERSERRWILSEKSGMSWEGKEKEPKARNLSLLENAFFAFHTEPSIGERKW